MKFVISTQELNFLISKCLNIIPLKPTIPLLANFLFEARDNELIITATDLTVGIRCCTEVKVFEEGSTTLPAKKFAQLVRELTSVNLEVKTNANEITEIKAGSSRFKLHGMSKDQFPALPDLEKALHFTVKQADLKDVLFRTSFAVSREDNRYVLTGTLLQILNGQATFIGTDGKRMARAIHAIDIDRSFAGNFIIPIKAVEEIFKNLNDEGDVKVYLMPDKVGVEMNNALIITKLLSGDYPDVARVIPATAETAVILHREELMTLLRQISLFTLENNHSVRFTLSDGELKLAANANTIGEGKVSMAANYHGPQVEIAFNPTYFLDILRHSKGETVTMGVTDSYNPGVITDQEMTSFVTANATPLFVLMPMRLSEE